MRAPTSSPLRSAVASSPTLRWNGITTYRELIVAPWRIVYRVDGALVLVVSVVDSRRRLEDLLLARFLRG